MTAGLHEYRGDHRLGRRVYRWPIRLRIGHRDTQSRAARNLRIRPFGRWLDLRGRPPWGLTPLIAVAALAAFSSPSSARELRFLRDGGEIRRLDVAELKGVAPPETVSVEDPFYQTRKRFVAVPLKAVLEAGFGSVASGAGDADFVFHALDGYTKVATGRRLSEDGGYLAIADADHARGDDPGWQPIDRRQVDPGPFYVVWTKPDQDSHRYPWPYQLAAIERVSFESKYPHTVPAGLEKDSAAWKGYGIFREQCLSCHSINGEGGKVGPDLNVPRSIVEYRPAAQVKEFIRDPEAFRYTTMPAHHHLNDRDLEDIIAYFEAMKRRKHDPRRTP